jgi:translation initiation factor IF-2
MIAKKKESTDKKNRKDLEAGLSEIKEDKSGENIKKSSKTRKKTESRTPDKKVKKSKDETRGAKKTEKKTVKKAVLKAKSEKAQKKKAEAGRKKKTESGEKKTAKKKTGTKAEDKTKKTKKKTEARAKTRSKTVSGAKGGKKASEAAGDGIAADEKEISGKKEPAETEEKLQVRTDWEKEKKLSIKSVIDRELDKEEKEGRLRVRLVQKKKSLPGKEKSKKALKEKDLKKEPGKRPEIKKVVEISEGISIKKLSEKINIPSHQIIELLFNMGEAININQSLSKDLIEFLSQEYNFKYHIIGFEEKLDEVYRDSEEELKPRPPIVTVMGHVDHGKTTLLDVIRETSVAVNEQGGITQSIGAYQIDYKNRRITFIDTPGHEAFTSIRARGAKVTDIAVIVVAADDGIMPQTVEAINHARDAGVPIIIAINKIDLPNADPDKVKKSLTEYNLVPEEWGGDTICIEISAKKKINLEEFLEMIILVADLNEIKGNPDSGGTGIIIESRLDKSLGPVGTVIVKRGKIKVGDSFITGDSFGRIRSIRDEYGSNIKEAVLSQPVEVVGFPTVPRAGDRLFVVKDDKSAKELLSRKNHERKLMEIADSRRTLTLEKLSELSKENEIIKLKIVLKADSEGSLDAVEKSLNNIKEEKIKIEIIHKAIGAITESDIMLAVASNAIVIGFCVPSTKSAETLYRKEGVDVRTYDIIYKLIDDVTLAFKGLLKPELTKVNTGKAEVREVFKLPKIGIIAGSYIVEGEVKRGDLVSVIRDGKTIYEGRVATLHRFKEDVKKVASGYECGIRIENFQEVKNGDIMEFFEERNV